VFDQAGNRKYLNETERRIYLKLISQEQDRLRRAFCLTLFYTGCRISEGLKLTAGRVDLTGKIIVFETLKRRRSGCFRTIPVPDELIRLLAELLTELNPSDRVWNFSRSTGYRLVKRYMVQAKIEGTQACPKGLRHAFAVACVGHEIPLTKVQKWMGHARLETTAIYLDVSGDEERKLAERLWLDKP